jgi:hypothetical protein
MLKWKWIQMKIMILKLQPSINHQQPVRKALAVKRLKKKGVPVSQNPRRNSTRVTNKYRLKSKAMFNPSIKEENIIVIEDHSEDVEASTKKKARKSSIT